MLDNKYLVAILSLVLFSLLVSLGPYDIFHMPFDLQAKIVFWELRLPRVLLAFFVGALLSICGCLFQSLFRNDLATPYTLGINSSASFGGVLAIVLGATPNIYGVDSISLLSMIMSLIAVFIMIGLGRKVNFNSSILLLTGVALGALASSLSMVLQFSASSSNLTQVIYWLMGSLEVYGLEKPMILSLFTSSLFLLLLKTSKELDIIKIDEIWALSKGIDVPRFKLIYLLLSSICLALAVAFCGPIGFVGLVIPNLIRKYTGDNHFDLIYYSFFIGGIFLMICDFGVRAIPIFQNIPIGVITSLIGAPFFINLVNKKVRGLLFS